MREIGIDLAREVPKALSDDDVRASDAVITMGCGDACPVLPGKRYLDGRIADPAGRSIGEVRRIRGAVSVKVEALLRQLGVLSV